MHRRAAAPLLSCLLVAACTDDSGGSSTGTDTTAASSTSGEDPTTGADPSTTALPTTEPSDATTSSSSSTTEPVDDSDSTTGSTSSTGDSTTGDLTTGTDTSTTSDSSTGDSSTGVSSTGDSSTTDSSTTAADEMCDVPDLEHAPPVTELDGLTAVPIDILAVDAVVTLDGATKTAAATATMHFRLGSDAGDPVFDLRQTILSAELDGEPIDPKLMASHDLGGGPNAGMRILDAGLAACSEHVLVLTYDLKKPGSPESRALVWEAQSARVKWDFWFSDLWPARYLESWFPANLIHDKFPFTLDITLANSQFSHLVASNGALEQIGPAQWKISYPPHFTALSPMLVLAPADRVQSSAVVLDLPDATSLTLEMWKDNPVAITFPEVTALLAPRFDEFVLSTGSYPHGDRFVAWVWDDPTRSMEYDGATTTLPAAADHELFHSWWGRGVKPASQNDGWIDEAWDMHSVTVGFNETPIDFGADPVVLSSPTPWNRITPDAAYYVGEQVFAGIGALVGTPALQAAMKSFFEQHVLDLVTTAALQRHLYCTLDEPGVIFIFHRFVYGEFGDPKAPPADYCD